MSNDDLPADGPRHGLPPAIYRTLAKAVIQPVVKSLPPLSPIAGLALDPAGRHHFAHNPQPSAAEF
jgi:hypothetical protein